MSRLLPAAEDLKTPRLRRETLSSGLVYPRLLMTWSAQVAPGRVLFGSSRGPPSSEGSRDLFAGPAQQRLPALERGAWWLSDEVSGGLIPEKPWQRIISAG